MTSKTLNIKTIRIDGGTQSRAEINSATVAEYGEALKEGITFPPVTVFFDGTDYWLADGFHRFLAHNTADKASIAADVRTGTQRDAQLFSFGVNAEHGLRRTNADKRKAVESMLSDVEWAQLSDREIAKSCAVSHTYVAAIRSPKPAATPTSTATAKPAPAVDKGTVTKVEPAATGNVASAPDAPAVKSQAQQDADQAADDAHGDVDTIVMLEELQADNKALQAKLAAATATDAGAEIVKWQQLCQVARNRQNELMASVNEREQQIVKLQKILRRICAAAGEPDPTKIAAVIEATYRELNKVPA